MARSMAAIFSPGSAAWEKPSAPSSRMAMATETATSTPRILRFGKQQRQRPWKAPCQNPQVSLCSQQHFPCFDVVPGLPTRASKQPDENSLAPATLYRALRRRALPRRQLVAHVQEQQAAAASIL